MKLGIFGEVDETMYIRLNYDFYMVFIYYCYYY